MKLSTALPFLYCIGNSYESRGFSIRPHHHINISSNVQIPRPSLRSLRSLSASRTNCETYNGEEEVEIDTAPCFDSVCTTDDYDLRSDVDGHPSTPSSSSSSSPRTTYAGTAIRRLGPSSNPTVWSEFGRIAESDPSIANLGQGFPDWLPPKFAVESLVDAVTDVSSTSPHQYTRTAGHGNLVRELAERYSVHLERKVDGMGEVAITVGASQALYLSLQTLIQPGDEVILFEPFFDLYVNQIKLAGGIPVYVPLTFQPYDDDDDNSLSGGEWVLDPQKLSDKLTSKTRAIILNSPHNPTGKIFTKTEMESIANAVRTEAPSQCVVLSDEVYKYIVHSPPKDEESTETDARQLPKKSKLNKPTKITSPGHTHFATLPDMWDRTITISSAGKTFSATGWQVGWAIGPKTLISPIHQLLPYVQFCAPTVIQEALARTLPKADMPFEGYASYYDYLKAMYTKKRDLLSNALIEAGFAIPDYERTPGGGFFIFARIGSDVRGAIPDDRIDVPNVAAPGGVARLDWALCQWMAEEKGVLCIPATPFFSEERVKSGEAAEFVRIAFCKKDETINAAAEALLRLQEDGDLPTNGDNSVGKKVNGTSKDTLDSSKGVIVES